MPHCKKVSRAMTALTHNEQVTQEQSYLAPPVDIYENSEHFVLVVDLPGVSKENLQIQLHDNQLTIEGKRESFDEEKNLLAEFRPAHFKRVFDVNDKFDVERIAAEMKEGVLTVTLPKSADRKVRQIQISA